MQKIKTFRAKIWDLDVRLDKILAGRFKDYTRHYLQKLIDEGEVTVNGKKAKASLKLRLADEVTVRFPAPKELKLKPAEIKLDIVYEDKNLMVINKPAGMVVHPGVGESHLEDSLVNAVLYHCKKSLSGIGGVMRPGIVHRLDKDTSGLLVVAKNDKTHQYLVNLFKERKVEKTYYALLTGRLVPEKGTIEAPIGRDVRDRKKMAVTSEEKGRMAITKYKVIKYLGESTYVEIKLVTGRTHQIRVHFASIGHPLAGDPIYGRLKLNKYFEQEYGLSRLFLHAGRLEFVLPGKKKPTGFETGLPASLQKVLACLKGEA